MSVRGLKTQSQRLGSAPGVVSPERPCHSLPPIPILLACHSYSSLFRLHHLQIAGASCARQLRHAASPSPLPRPGRRLTRRANHERNEP